MSTAHFLAARNMRQAILARANRVHPVVASPGFARSIPTLLARKAALASIGAGDAPSSSSVATRKDSLDLIEKTTSKRVDLDLTSSGNATSDPSTMVIDESDTSSVLSLSSTSGLSSEQGSDAVCKKQRQQQQEHVHEQMVKAEDVKDKGTQVQEVERNISARVQPQQQEEPQQQQQQKQQQPQQHGPESSHSHEAAAEPEAEVTSPQVEHDQQARIEASPIPATLLPSFTTSEQASRSFLEPEPTSSLIAQSCVAPDAALPNPSSPALPTKSRKGFFQRLLKLGKSRHSKLQLPAQDSSVSTPAPRIVTPLPAQKPVVAPTPVVTKAEVPICSVVPVDKQSRAGSKSVAQRFVSAATRVLRLPSLGAKDCASASKKGSSTASPSTRNSSSSSSQVAANGTPGLTLSLLSGLPDIITDSFAAVLEHGHDAPSVYRGSSGAATRAVYRSKYDKTTGMRLGDAASPPEQARALITMCNVVKFAYIELAHPLISAPMAIKLLDMAGASNSQAAYPPSAPAFPQPFTSSVSTQVLAHTLAQDFVCSSTAVRRYALEAALGHLAQLLAVSTHEKRSAVFDLATFWVIPLFGYPCGDFTGDPSKMILFMTQKVALLQRMITEAPVLLAALAAVDNFNIVDEAMA